MREIKFRGFSKKHQQWLTGNYILNRGAHFIAPVDEPADGKTWEDYEVNPDTVGQFTGRKDLNFCDIYDGDIVRDHSDPMGNGDVGAVVYDEAHAIFAIRYYNDTPDESITYGMYDCKQKELEVIGNIHDNPELLKRNEQ